jgi:monoamine oxidase
VKFDVLVVGAGASGLAAARVLSGAGKRVCIVEARQRTGGRIHTLHVAGLPLPVELGAEFIHGEAHETFSIVKAAALIACELPDDHWFSRHGQWQRIDYWQRVDKVRRQIGRLEHDMPFAEVLRSRRGLSSELRELVRNFVEGYHAAHIERMSTMALSSADEEQEEPGGNKQFRILNGYDALTEWLRAGLDPETSELLLGTQVRQITWRDGDAVADCVHGHREQTLRASAAVITIPIGVWKAPHEQDGAIRFDPPLDDKTRAVAKLEVGHVVKTVFRFHEPFWAERRMNFMHVPDRFVPTWWTSAPVRQPILTAWSGGHAADALLAEGDDAMIDRALDTLARIFAMRRRAVDDLVAGSYTHNWQSDPFSRGAYSYAGVGGTSAHKDLARPIRATLFFAGEATSGDQTGTVAGAIESGHRAARQVLKSARGGK